MKIVIKSKNMDLPEPIRDYAERKLGKLDRYVDNISSITVELGLEKVRSADHRHTAQVTIATDGAILRGEERADDIRKAIDAVAEVMARQITRYKEKLYSRGRPSEGRAAGRSEEAEAPSNWPERRIVKTKQHAIKPLAPDEAVEQMELLGHDFFVFYNAQTGQMNVLYRRADGDYGLIEPEPE